ncbi:hypothetical protein JAAARDRAFT_713111 [Jaapia argillacea MUCL 33604]|uniref:Uncharacterized protein n=1 Tax=Jaapia argillacea MUCL 33604 TaxID=933084 RepID=A0A067PGU1_9AGAM|nr:hypothetical protein JAAARDRAFT_713111 [Jaapia argillacea MUCL 33604]
MVVNNCYGSSGSNMLQGFGIGSLPPLQCKPEPDHMENPGSVPPGSGSAGSGSGHGPGSDGSELDNGNFRKDGILCCSRGSHVASDNIDLFLVCFRWRHGDIVRLHLGFILTSSLMVGFTMNRGTLWQSQEIFSIHWERMGDVGRRLRDKS